MVLLFPDRPPLQPFDFVRDRPVALYLFEWKTRLPRNRMGALRPNGPFRHLRTGSEIMSKGDQTRQRIVAQAASLFNQRGYEGSSMAELMEATGLEKGGIYRHFSNKEELAAEAFDYAWHEALKTRTHDLGTITNSVDRLKQFIANFIERRPAIPGGCPLMNTT